MSFATCVMIAGSLWISDGFGDQGIKAVTVGKDPGYETVQFMDPNGAWHELYIQQHQLRMGAEEFLSDCVALGNDKSNFPTRGYDDIDETETTAD